MQTADHNPIEWRLHWQDEGDTLVIECSGTLTADGAAALRDELLSDLRVLGVPACVADLRALCFDLLSAASLRTLAHGHGRVPDTGTGTRLALVVAGRRAYGLCRMYVALSSLVRAPGTTEVFTELDAAVDWVRGAPALGEQGQPEPARA